MNYEQKLKYLDRLYPVLFDGTDKGMCDYSE